VYEQVKWQSGSDHRRQQRHRSGDRTAVCREGAYVFITSRRQTELDKAKALIGKNVTAVQGDIANLNDLTAYIRRLRRRR
jgi:NADP-dependent 3-hydroxy acid dehydrogenase YdfG